MSEPNTLVTFGTGLLSGLTVGVVGTVLSRSGLRRPRLRVHRAGLGDNDPAKELWWVNIVQGLMGGKATVTHIWVETSAGDAEILSPDLPHSFEPGGPGREWGIPVAFLPAEDLREKFRAHTTTSSRPLKSKYREPIRPAGPRPCWAG
jgi:hypothetical protein